MLSHLAEIAPVGMAVTGPDGLVRYINPALLKTDSKEGVATEEFKEFCDHRDQFFARMFSSDYNRFASNQSAKSPAKREFCGCASVPSRKARSTACVRCAF